MVYDEAPAAAPAAPAAPAPAAAPVEAAAAAAPAAPAAEPTLHDFVLNLLQDPTAMQAFDLDPSGCLKNAGLTDITPADVHDVIPLVTDLVPTGGLPGLGAVPGLDIAMPSLDSLPSVPSLDDLPSVPSVPSLDELTSSLSLDGGAGPDGGWVGLSGDSPLGALAGKGAVDAGLDGVRAGVLGVHDTPLGHLGIGAWGDASLEGVNAGADIYTPLGDVKASSFNDVDGSQFLYLDTDSSNGTESDALAVQQDLLPTLPAVGDLAKGLSDPTAAASAIAGAVPALPAVPGLPQLPVSDLPLPSVPELPVDLPVDLPAVPVAGLDNTVDGAQGTANGAVDGGQSGSLPDLGGHLPNLPDVGGLLPNLPVNLPDLPVHLPQLPVELPSVVPNLPVVGDVVDHTGLGGVLNNNPVTETVHNIVPDLHLGL